MTRVLRRTLIIAAAALVLGLAAIGAGRAVTGDAALGRPVAVAPAGGDTAGAANGRAAVGTAAAGDAVVAELDAVLAADQAATPAAQAATRGQLRRLAAWSRLVHATVVVDLPALGGLTTIQLDHGTISAVSATSLTIAEAGGGSVTVTLSDETRVRRAGAKAAIADLKAADEVFVMSKVTAGGTEGYLVVVPKK
jgi:hypothetical protein